MDVKWWELKTVQAGTRGFERCSFSLMTTINKVQKYLLINFDFDAMEGSTFYQNFNFLKIIRKTGGIYGKGQEKMAIHVLMEKL